MVSWLMRFVRLVGSRTPGVMAEVSTEGWLRPAAGVLPMGTLSAV